MTNSKLRRWSTRVVASGLLIVIAGCVDQPELPSTVNVLAEGRSIPASLGAGAASLAGSQWQFSPEPVPAGPIPVLLVTFDEDGGLDRFDENSLIPEVIGTSLLLDGGRHASLVEGVEYVAGVYGGQSSDGSAFAYQGRVRLFYSGIEAARGRVNFEATLDADDPDVMHGSMEYSISIVDLVRNFVPEAVDQQGDLRFVGRRIVN